MTITGAKGGGSSSFKQTPDNLRSEDTFEGVLGLCLGPIKGPVRGLKSIKVDGTQVENETGELNFKDFILTFADGDPLLFPQLVKLRLGAGASPQAVNLALSNNNGSNPVWVTRTLNNTNANYIDLRFIVAQLYRQDKKGIFDETATLEIQMKPTGSTTWINPTLNGSTPTPYQEEGYFLEDFENDYRRVYLPRAYFNVGGTNYASSGSNYKITGKTTSPSVYELRIGVPSTGNYANTEWDVRVRLLERETYDNGSGENNVQEKRAISWESLAAVYSNTMGDKPGWQGVSWLQLYGKASDQLSGVPGIEGEYDTKIVPVPPTSIFNPGTRAYTSAIWDGSWEYSYTNDPAWALGDLIGDPIGGLAAMAPGSFLNKWDALEASKWFSELVPDGDGGIHPRYSMNLAVTEKQKAPELVRYMAGAVGGLAWDDGNGEWRLKVDKPEKAVDVFTVDNIVGDVNYSHTDVDTRFNDITGKFLNAEMDYREDSVRLYDQASIDKIGRKPTTIALVGCTNRQEAMRRTMMRLRSSVRETRMANFTTNRKGKNLSPLDHVLLADQSMGDSEQRTTGRVIGLSVDRRTLTLRDTVRVEAGVEYWVNFSLVNPDYDPNTSTQPTSEDWTKPLTVKRIRLDNASARGNVKTLFLDDPLPSGTAEYLTIALEAIGMATFPKMYRILGLEPQEDGELVAISAIEVDVDKWDAVDGVSKEDSVYVGLRGKPGQPLLFGGQMLALHTSASLQGVNVTLQANWMRPADRRVVGTRVRYQVNGGNWEEPLPNTQLTDFALVNPVPGIYVFELTSIARDGTLSAPVTEEIEITQTMLNFEDGATRNNPRGFYTSGATYVPGDWVVWRVEDGGDGNSYQRKAGTGDTTGTPPSDTTKWQLVNIRGQQGATGAAGQAGAQGNSLYTWIAYADNVSGTVNFTSGAWTNQTYIGIANNKTTSTESTNPADYTWSLIKGSDGVPGTPGDDGTITYTWFAYATTANGVENFTTGVPTPGLHTYLGLAANKLTATESTNPEDYNWSLLSPDVITLDANKKFAKYDTNDNYVGGSITFTTIRKGIPANKVWGYYLYRLDTGALINAGTAQDYANAHSDWTTTSPDNWTWAANTVASYVNSYGGFRVEAYSDGYTARSSVTIQKVRDGQQGAQGATGPAGAAGAQGNSLYTWIAYADSPGGNVNFTTGAWVNQTYIGIANNKTTSTESTSPPDYTWSLIKGTDGVPGSPGANGQTTYTWFAYATSADGVSNFTTGAPTSDFHTYLGVAANKTTATESTNPADYNWSLIKGATGAQGNTGPSGSAGPQGPAVYTWFAYANDSNGTTNFTTGAWTNQTYIGVANNKFTTTESTNPGDYNWSLIKGTDGIPGTPGSNGTTTYTWVAYATSSNGVNDFTTGAPTSNFHTYLGIAANKTTATESTNPADYFWSLIKGADGISPVNVSVSPTSRSIKLDVNSAPKSGQLPLVFDLSATKAGAPATITGINITGSTGGTWAVVGNSVRLTALGGGAISGEVEFSVTAGGETLTGNKASFSSSQDPANLNQITKEFTPTVSNASGTSATAIGSPLSYTARANGTLTANLYGYVRPNDSGGNNVGITYTYRTKLQYSLNSGSSWVDVSGSNNVSEESIDFSGGEPGVSEDWTAASVNGAGPYYLTGLGASANVQFRVLINREGGFAINGVDGVLTIFLDAT